MTFPIEKNIASPLENTSPLGREEADSPICNLRQANEPGQSRGPGLDSSYRAAGAADRIKQLVPAAPEKASSVDKRDYSQTQSNLLEQLRQNMPAGVLQACMQNRQAHADAVLSGGMLGSYEFAALAELSRSALVFLSDRGDGNHQVVTVVEPPIPHENRNPPIFITNDSGHTHFDAFMPADYFNHWADAGPPQLSELKDRILRGRIIPASGQNNDCCLDSIRKFAQAVDTNWQPFDRDNAQIRQYLYTAVLNTDPCFFDRTLQGQFDQASASEPGRPWFPIPILRQAAPETCSVQPTAAPLGPDPVATAIKPPPDNGPIGSLFARICALDLKQTSDLARFFSAGTRMRSISQSGGAIDINALQSCPTAVQFYLKTSQSPATKAPTLFNHMLVEIGAHIQNIVPENNRPELSARLESLQKFLSQHFNDNKLIVGNLCRNWIEFAAELTNAAACDRIKALGFFPLPEKAEEWHMCLGGIQTRLEEARACLHPPIEQFQLGCLQNRISSDLRIHRGNEIHAEFFLKYLLGLPKDVAGKKDSHLYSVRNSISGKQAFLIIEPSCFGADILQAILEAAGFYEQMLQKACEESANPTQAYMTMETDWLFRDIGFPIQTDEGVLRYIDYDLDENGNDTISFRKEQFAVDLALRLTASNYLELNGESHKQNRYGHGQRSARDTAQIYWDERLEKPELLIQDIKGADLNQKAKALYMLLAMAQGGKNQLIWPAHCVFEQIDGELPEAVNQCRAKNMIQLNLAHLATARDYIKARIGAISANMDAQTRQLVDFALGISTHAPDAVSRETLEETCNALRLGNATVDGVMRLYENYRKLINPSEWRKFKGEYLFWAAQDGNKAVIEKMLNTRINANMANNNGFTALHLAAKEGHIAVVNALLSARNINVNKTDRHGLTALHWAAKEGHTAIVNALLAVEGINVKKADRHGFTVLHWAAHNGHIAIVNALLAARNIDINKTDGNGFTALHWAAHNGHIAIVNALLAARNIDINKTDWHGFTALHWAANEGRTAIVNALLAVKDINVNKVKGLERGTTALHLAADEGHTAIVNAVLAVKDINVNKADRQGFTALHLAARNGHIAVVNALLAVNNIDIDNIDDWGATPLRLAAAGGHAAIVDALHAAKNINADKIDDCGDTARTRKADKGHIAIADALPAAKRHRGNQAEHMP